MTTEIEHFQSRDSMPAKITYAKALADSGLLPAAFRKQPANVLYAIEYGDMLGLAPMAAITGIHVIDGKPSASAGLISALVRRAGHKLRVSGDSGGATCQIVRADEPGYVFEVTFTMDDARTAGLLGKDVWKKYATSMLKARAVTQCARDACEEVLYGLHYTPEELGADVDGDGNPVVAKPAGNGQPQAPAGDGGEVVDAEVVTDPEWLDAAFAKGSVFETADDGRALWAEVAGKHRDGQCTTGDRRRLQALITARFAELKAETVPAAAVTVIPPLGPEDPWTAKIDDIADPEEAAEVAAEFEQLCQAGDIPPAHAAQIRAAITAKTATVTGSAA